MNFIVYYPERQMDKTHINNILYIVSCDDESSHHQSIQETPTNKNTQRLSRLRTQSSNKQFVRVTIVNVLHIVFYHSTIIM